MTLVRWRPLRDIAGVQDEINRAFDDLWRQSRQTDPRGGTWWPSVDLMENETEFKVVAELPGMKRDDIKLSITENLLTVRGEKKVHTEEKNETWHQVERSYGSFERAFQLSWPGDAGRVKAHFEDGVLAVTLPKSEASRPREISIDA